MVVGSKLIESRIWLTRFHAVTKPITRDRVCTAENLEPVRSAKIDERSRRVMAVIIHSLEGVGTKRRLQATHLTRLLVKEACETTPPLMETEMPSITYVLREWYRFFLYIRFPPLVIPRRREFSEEEIQIVRKGREGWSKRNTWWDWIIFSFLFFSRMERAFEIFAQIRDGGQAR